MATKNKSSSTFHYCSSVSSVDGWANPACWETRVQTLILNAPITLQTLTHSNLKGEGGENSIEQQGKTARSKKCLLHRYANLSSNPQTLCKRRLQQHTCVTQGLQVGVRSTGRSPPVSLAEWTNSRFSAIRSQK